MGESPEGPRISADGRFYWDGAHWAPIPDAPAELTKPNPSRLPGILVLSGAALVLLGAFLPWIDATAPFVGTISRSLVNLGGDGEFLAGGALAGALIGLIMLVRGPNVVLGVLAMLLALLAIWIIVVDYQAMSGRVANLTTTGDIKFIADVGPGPYVAGVGVILWAIGTVVGFVKRSAAETLPASPPLKSTI
jgi:hypothetical protein